MRKLFILLVACVLSLVISLSLFSTPAEAKHKASHGSKSPTFSAVRAKNKLSVTASFGNLLNTKSIAYQLTYDSAKGPQGAGGTIKVGKYKKLSRKLLFGTCSGRVCTYHNDVRNAVLSVDFNLKSGGVVSYEKRL